MNMGNNHAERLKSFVSRIENLEASMKELSEDRSSIYKEAKDCDIDTKALRAIIRIRKQNVTERKAHEEIVAQYMSALGMLADTELGQAAIKRATGG